MSREILRETNQEITGIKHNSDVAQTVEIPTVLRTKGGIIRWNLPGNTPEENELMGIQNVQGLFLEAHPELLERVSFGEDGMIVEDQRDDARGFILKHVGTSKNLSLIIGASSFHKLQVPYFHGNYRTILSKSFSPWGITFEWKEPAPDGWITNKALSKQISRAEGVVKKIANQYRESHPELFEQYLDSSGKSSEHYHPELIEKINKESSKAQSALEGWVTNKALSKQISKHTTTVRRIANQFRESNPEWFKEYLNSGGRACEHYSPELVEQIDHEASKIKPAPESWVTNKALAKLAKRDFTTITRLVNKVKTSHPEWFRVYLDPVGKPTEHYSPELVELITQEASKIQPAPEGWVTNLALSMRVQRDRRTVIRLANSFRTTHSEWFKEYLNSGGRPLEHYSPELVEAITKDFNEKRQQEQTISPEQANEELMRFLEVKDE